MTAKEGNTDRCRAPFKTGKLLVDGVEADTHEGEAGDEHPKDPHMFFLDSFPAEAVNVRGKEDSGEDDNSPVLDGHPVWFFVGGGVVEVGEIGVTAGDDADIGEREENEPYPHASKVAVSHCLVIIVVVKRRLGGRVRAVAKGA